MQGGSGTGFIQAATGLVFWIAVLGTYVLFPVVYPTTYALIYGYSLESVGPSSWVLDQLSWMWGVALAFLSLSSEPVSSATRLCAGSSEGRPSNLAGNRRACAA